MLDPFPEAREARQAVGAAFDRLDLVDDALGVATRGRLLEVGERSIRQPFSPCPNAGKEGIAARSAATRKRSSAVPPRLRGQPARHADPGPPGDEGPQLAAEEVAQLVPQETKVANAFNTTFAGALVDGEVAGQ